MPVFFCLFSFIGGILIFVITFGPTTRIVTKVFPCSLEKTRQRGR